MDAHVEKTIDPHPFDDRLAALGKRVGDTDETLEAHLHEKFDHQLGQLDHQSVEEPHQRDVSTSHIRPSDPNLAATASEQVAQVSDLGDLAAMLHHTDNLRQIVILSEILKRPEDRL